MSGGGGGLWSVYINTVNKQLCVLFTTWARENSNLEKIIFYIRDVKWV